MTTKRKKLNLDINEAAWTALALAMMVGLIAVTAAASLVLMVAGVLSMPFYAAVTIAKNLAQRNDGTPATRTARRTPQRKSRRRQSHMSHLKDQEMSLPDQDIPPTQ